MAFSDGKITNATYIDAGDTVVVQFISTGTNTGSFAGLPPTGRHVIFQFVEILGL
jgi:predicted ester cyclase